MSQTFHTTTTNTNTDGASFYNSVNFYQTFVFFKYQILTDFKNKSNQNLSNQCQKWKSAYLALVFELLRGQVG